MIAIFFCFEMLHRSAVFFGWQFEWSILGNHEEFLSRITPLGGFSVCTWWTIGNAPYLFFFVLYYCWWCWPDPCHNAGRNVYVKKKKCQEYDGWWNKYIQNKYAPFICSSNIEPEEEVWSRSVRRILFLANHLCLYIRLIVSFLGSYKAIKVRLPKSHYCLKNQN